MRSDDEEGSEAAEAPAIGLNGRIDAAAERATPGLIETRRAIHRHPEPAFEEHETARLVAGRLRDLGVPSVRTGVGRTGVVALIEGGAGPGSTVGVRADMDALPIEEATGLPFASERPGLMHACGHDVHTAITLGVAEVLVGMRDALPGRIKLIFQPAEETLEGAPAMIADGVLDDPPLDCIVGFHNSPQLAAGTVGYHPTVAMASFDAFDITVRGAAGHGAHPHSGIDAIVAAAHLVTQLQTIISREVAPSVPAVLSIGQVVGGTARNVIAEQVVLKGAVRSLDERAAAVIEAAVRRMLDGARIALRVETELYWRRLAPVLRNDPAVLARVVAAARDVLGPAQVLEMDHPSMGSEDFAWFAERVPAAHLRIGSQIDGLDARIHRSNYDCNDLAIPTGVRAVARAVLALADAGGGRGA
jgi:amidohydrolase